MPARKLFVNLPVRDLEKTKAFFAGLGFEYNPQFTDEKAACMLIGEDAYAMLLATPFFQTFTDRAPCDTSKATEAILAISCTSKAEVDAMVAKALATGGAAAKPKNDLGFMYNGSFYDVDGHHWEVLWMDPAAIQ